MFVLTIKVSKIQISEVPLYITSCAIQISEVPLYITSCAIQISEVPHVYYQLCNSD